MRKLIVALLLFAFAWPHPAHAAVVLSAERDIAALPYEVGIGYDRSGRERWRFVGTEDGQAAMPEWMPRSIRGGVFSHNHVGEDHCVNLSVDDVQFGAYYRLSEIRAVGIENGVVTVGIIYRPRNISEAQWNDAFERFAALPWCERIAAAWASLGVAFERVSG